MEGRMIEFKTGDPDEFVEKMALVSKNLTVKRSGRSAFQADIRLADYRERLFFRLTLKTQTYQIQNQEILLVSRFR